MRYSGMIRNDVVNGQNVCVSFWTQGCPHHCEGCHNPETWDFNGGIEADDNDLINKVITALNQNGVQRNLSILGGEPLCDSNIRFVRDLICRVKYTYPGITIFVWTGYTIEEIVEAANSFNTMVYGTLKNIDYLIEGRFELDKRDITLPLAGSTNQRIVDVQQTMKNAFNPIIYKEYKDVEEL